MSEVYTLLKRIVFNIEGGHRKTSLDLSITDVHAKGLFSLVVDGTEFGKLTRIFIADKKIKPFDVQLHTHRYPLRLTTICGKFTHHLAIETPQPQYNSKMTKYSYKSFLLGGSGLSYLDEVNVVFEDYLVPPASQIELGVEDFHTVSVSKGTMWIVEELGFEKDSSEVLGVPFITEGLYNQPEMFQVNDKCQLVLKELKKIIREYDNVGFKC